MDSPRTERAARQIISAVRQRKPEIILTPAAQIVSRVAGLAPGLTSAGRRGRFNERPQLSG